MVIQSTIGGNEIEDEDNEIEDFEEEFIDQDCMRCQMMIL